MTKASKDFVVNINICPPNRSWIAFVISTPGTIGMTAAMIIVAKSPLGTNACPITEIIPITKEPMNSGINCACSFRSNISTTKYPIVPANTAVMISTRRPPVDRGSS